MAAVARFLETEAEKQEEEGVASLLLHKIKKGIATAEDRRAYRYAIENLAVYDWGTESYQNYVPNQLAAAKERQQAKRKAGRSLIAPAPGKQLPKPEAAAPTSAGLPPLPKRKGKFGI